MGVIICPCGKEVKNWQKGVYQIIEKDNNGKVIYEKCYHGKVIMNNKRRKQ